MKTIFVGNLPFKTTEDEIRNLFSQHGTVDSVKFILDRQTNRFKGFCFVDMEDEAAKVAIEKLNGADLGGRPMRVNEAKQREPNQ